MANIVMVLTSIITGLAMNYDPGVFDTVWQTRQYEMKPCKECVGYAAMDCQYKDRRVWVSNGQEWVGPLHVIDCGVWQTPGVIIEVDKWLATRWGMRAPINVRVSFQAPKEMSDEERCATLMRELREAGVAWNWGFC